MKFGSFDERHRLKMLAIILKLDRRRERTNEGRKEGVTYRSPTKNYLFTVEWLPPANA
jgi:hypothetical protein